MRGNEAAWLILFALKREPPTLPKDLSEARDAKLQFQNATGVGGLGMTAQNQGGFL